MHPFGAWIANDLALNHRDEGQVVKDIHFWRASNGEEIHGFTWQINRLHALGYPGDGPGAYRRMDAGELSDSANIPDGSGEDLAVRICHQTWWMAQQSIDDCSHAIGHSFFYHYMDIGRAAEACWTDKAAIDVPPWVGSKELLRWRWICATGVYHSAVNTLSLEALYVLQDAGILVEDLICKRTNRETEDRPYFVKCAAGLGVQEAEEKLDRVRKNVCYPKRRDDGTPYAPAQWEVNQLKLTDIMQRTCHTGRDFAIALDLCPKAWMAHWPCYDWRADKGQCDTQWHEHCETDYMLRETFKCEPANQVNWAGMIRPEVNHVIDGDPGVGIWGGKCTCPNGYSYLVGDEGNACGSLACENGQPGECMHYTSSWAFRKVVCDANAKPMDFGHLGVAAPAQEVDDSVKGRLVAASLMK